MIYPRTIYLNPDLVLPPNMSPPSFVPCDSVLLDFTTFLMFCMSCLDQVASFGLPIERTGILPL